MRKSAKASHSPDGLVGDVGRSGESPADVLQACKNTKVRGSIMVLTNRSAVTGVEGGDK